MASYYQRNKERLKAKSLKNYYRNKTSILIKKKLKKHYYNPEKRRLYYLNKRYGTTNPELIKIIKDNKIINGVRYYDKIENGQKVYYSIPLLMYQ